MSDPVALALITAIPSIIASIGVVLGKSNRNAINSVAASSQATADDMSATKGHMEEVVRQTNHLTDIAVSQAGATGIETGRQQVIDETAEKAR
jgi:hypothetical protein